MSTTLSERDIQNSILSYLKLRGIFCWPVNSVGLFDPTKKVFRTPGKHFLKGVSDILGCLKGGRLLAIEVKTKQGRPTPEQIAFLDLVNQMGGIAFIARSIEDVEDKFKSKSIVQECHTENQVQIPDLLQLPLETP